MFIDFHKIGLVFIVVAFFTLLLRLSTIEHNASNYINGMPVSFSAVLTQEPKISGQYQTFSVKTDKNDKVVIKTSRYPEYHYGQKLAISGTISIKSVQSTSTSTSSVPSNKRPATTIYFPKITLEKNQDFMFVGKSLAVVTLIRQKIVTLFKNSLRSPDSELMLGIVFGIQSQMPKDFMNNLRNSGVLHVIAASGMNVTLVAGFFTSLFALFFRRQVALLVSILGIIFYAALAGFEPSILRASIMGIIVFSAQIFGRQSLALFNLLFAGYVMLMVSPDLLTDIGFQLSFCSTLGLIIFKPVLDRKLHLQNIAGEDISTTICAQVATLPILLANFGTYSLWSLAANALTLWMIPFLMIIGALGAVLGFVHTGLAQLVLLICLPFLWFFERVVSFFGGMGALQIQNFSWEMGIGYYLILSSIILILRRNA